MTAPRQQGFTLVELMVSVAILGIIMSALVGALLTFLSNGKYATQRDDHTSGAALLSTYLDRDLASADTVTGGSGPSCPGAGTVVLTLSWTEYTASPASPSPTPAGTWQASYAVTPDPASSTATDPRSRLERRLCPPSGATQTTQLVTALTDPGGGAVTAAAVAGGGACPASTSAVEVTLPTYVDDDSTQGYSYVGCVRGRTS